MAELGGRAAPPARSYAGLFIAIEGGDGAGKGGVVEALRRELNRSGHEVVVTREPGGTPEGEKLRSLLVAESQTWHPEAELLLMTAARVQHVADVIMPSLSRGAVVLCDRFVGSTIAYQGAGRELGTDKILQLHRTFLRDLWPDVTLVLDVDPKVGLGRSRAKLAGAAQDEGRFEALADAFHERVRNSFLRQAADHPDRHIIVESHGSAAEVQEQAVARVTDRVQRMLEPLRHQS